MTILAESASIMTASVEIKALMIGKKQMTLAVFKQLPKGLPFDPETGKWLGSPWGHVNYCPSDCRVEGHHMHIVWQRGQQLLRCSFPLTDPTVEVVARLGQLEAMLCEDQMSQAQVNSLAEGGRIALREAGGNDPVYVRVDLRGKAKIVLACSSYYPWRQGSLVKEITDLADIFRSRGHSGVDARNMLYQQAMVTVSAHRRMRRNAETLEQLFIAV